MPSAMRTQSRHSGGAFIELGFTEVVIPSLWETSTFTDKLGPEKEGQMWAFRDKGGRDCCLIPEVTGVIQQMWREGWSKTMRPGTRLAYVSRCYRYERPQAGRYREFTQFGVEILGDRSGNDAAVAREALQACVSLFDADLVTVGSVKRGLAYYVEDGFEVECPDLGAQRQVAGGGRYAEGIGWAIGVERMLLAEDAKAAARPG